MFVIEVIPLKRGIQIESLSYYSSIAYPSGTILTVPIRNGQVQAIVVAHKPVSAAKTALRTATFSLKKLPEQKDARTLPSSVIKTAQKMCDVAPAHLGSILFSMLPPDIRAGIRTYPVTTEHVGSEDFTPTILTETTDDRYITYRSQIRQTFAHRGSVLFVVPNSVAVHKAKEKLSNGIEKRVVTFSSTQTKKQITEAYAGFDDLSQAKLIVVTPSYAFLDRHDITTIIVESSGSPHYKSRTRPYLDARELLKTYAKQTGRSILLGDAVPSTEDEIYRRDERYNTFGEHTKRLVLSGNIVLAKHERKDDEPFTLCTQELIDTITRSLSSKGQVFLLASRRGLAPLVSCFDCGHIFRCPDSGAPYSLLKTHVGDEEKRWFVSATSGKRIRAADTCPSCESWRLREQGIGIQYVHEVIKKQFSNESLFLFDHTTATTHLKATKIIDAFYTTKRSILIGTSMALPYLTKPVDCSAVISYEAARSIPTWKADETIFSLLVQLREITIKDVVVQLRTEEDDIIPLASKGLVDQFYDDEIKVREALSYPPYATFILLSWFGSKEQTIQVEATIEKQLTGFKTHCYSGPHSTESKTQRYCLLRIEVSKWPDKVLVEKLRALPPYIKIELNPDRIV